MLYICILYIIATELLIELYINLKPEPNLRQKTVLCFTLILLIGSVLNTNYQNSPKHSQNMGIFGQAVAMSAIPLMKALLQCHLVVLAIAI